MTSEIKSAFEIVGYVSTIIVIISTLLTVGLWVRGIFPVLLRLGNGLSMRKIAVFAKGENLSSLKSLLLDSKLFSQQNVIGIGSKADFGRADDASVYLISWSDWSDEVSSIISKKPDRYPAIIYSQKSKEIPQDMMIKLGDTRNISVTNFRGRLLNDIVTAMITTSYDKK